MRFWTFLVLGTVYCHLNAQNLRLGIEPGLRLSPMDRLIGPSLGVELQNDSRVSLLIREDGLISKFGIEPNNYYVMIFSTSLFLSYEILERSLYSGAGIIHVSRRNDDHYLLNGIPYNAIGVFGHYRIKNLILELRGEIPLGPDQRIVTYGYLFPLTIAVHYHIDIKGNR